MKSATFYGRKKTFPNANREEELSDESALSDSDDDVDFVQPNSAGRSTDKSSKSSSSESNEEQQVDISTTSRAGTAKKKLLWKTVSRNETVQADFPTVYESNLYSIQINSDKPLKLTKAELGQFLGCCMLMSIFILPRSRMYWGKKTRIEQIADVMQRVRWEEIKASLHFNDNSNVPSLQDPARDRIFKCRSLRRRDHGCVRPQHPT